MGMAKYDRLLYILNLLRSRRTLNARRLAEECEVTERSIYRDLISLSEANIPIYYDRGYKLASSNFLPPLNFTFDEYTCLKLALDSSPLAKAGPKAETIRRVKAKIDCGLSEATRAQKTTAPDIAHIDIDTTVSQKAAIRCYSALEKAVSERVSIELEYETVEHGLTHRTVDPYFIVFRRHAFYFVGYCRLRQEFRTFRLDRIRRLVSTDRRFIRDKRVNAADYFDGSWEFYQDEPVEVEVLFSGVASRVVATSRHHPAEKTESVGPDRLRYRVSVRGTEEIKRWLLGFGPDAEVLRPAGLRQELCQIGRRLAEIYRKS